MAEGYFGTLVQTLIVREWLISTHLIFHKPNINPEGYEAEYWKNQLVITDTKSITTKKMIKKQTRDGAYQYNGIPGGKYKSIGTRYNPWTRAFKLFFDGINKIKTLQCTVRNSIFLSRLVVITVAVI